MGRILTAVRRDIRELPGDVQKSGLAALAISLADNLDKVPNASMAKQLRETLQSLTPLKGSDARGVPDAPTEPTDSEVKNELSKLRDQRARRTSA